MRQQLSLSGKNVFQYAAVFVLVLLLIGIPLFETSRSATATLQMLHSVTITTDVHATGVVLRDETVLGSDDIGPVRYLLTDGTAVQKGTHVAKVYQDDTGTDKRARAAELTEEMARLEAYLATVDGVWQAQYHEAYEHVMDAVSRGAFEAALSDAERLGVAESGRDAAALAETYRARLAELEAAFDELVRNAPYVSDVTAKTDGLFYRTTDGFEARLGAAAAATLTASELTALLSTREPGGKTVGKIVSDGTWHFAVPCSEETAALFVAEDSYMLQFEGYGEVSMRLARIAPAPEGGEALLVFTADKVPEGFGSARRRNVTVAVRASEGFALPGAALHREDGQTVIYVFGDGTAHRRTVEVLREDGGGLLVAAVGEGALSEGDRLIVTTRRLYDGKAVRVYGNG